MIYQDSIYGKIDIKDKVIIELINSQPFQRLKKIGQSGAAYLIQPRRNGTRYEHSIGVWYLSTLFKRTIEEQIACLLHDLSHTAFSHVIDYVVGDKNQGYADKRLNEMILESSIPSILKKNNLDINIVLDKSKFPLLDNNLPDISFDRLDYFLRDGYMMSFIPSSTINDILSGLKESEDILYFEDENLAALTAILFCNFARLIWNDPTGFASYLILADAIKISLKKEYITEDDFFTDDEILLNKLKSIDDKDINKCISRLVPGNEFEYSDIETSEFSGPVKIRTIDPLVKVNDELKRISSLVPSLEYYLKEYAQKYKYVGMNEIKN